MSGALKILAYAKLARTGMLDWQAVWTGFGEVAPPLGATALVTSTVLEARTRPSGLDLVFQWTDEFHLAPVYVRLRYVQMATDKDNREAGGG
jgi:hypothetical protein